MSKVRLWKVSWSRAHRGYWGSYGNKTVLAPNAKEAIIKSEFNLHDIVGVDLVAEES